MTGFDFSSVYAKEKSKTLLQETVQLLIKDAAEQGLSNFDIAQCLMRGARDVFDGWEAFGPRLDWWSDSRRTFIHLHDNEITSREEIIGQLANRNLTAREIKPS